MKQGWFCLNFKSILEPRSRYMVDGVRGFYVTDDTAAQTAHLVKTCNTEWRNKEPNINSRIWK